MRSAAATAGLNDQQIENMLDSDQFHQALNRIDVEAPSFGREVSALVRRTAPNAPSQPPAAQASGAQAAADPGSRQWTEADILALPQTREGAQRLNAAAAAGLLKDLGYGLDRHELSARRHG